MPTKKKIVPAKKKKPGAKRKPGPTGLPITVKDDKGTRRVGTGSGKKQPKSAYSPSAQAKAKPAAKKRTYKDIPTGVNIRKGKLHTVGDTQKQIKKAKSKKKK